ncbi:PorP/SprF family type IX secretion system membrane protein [Alkalitalea saponilacus]|uniref:Type IX secretion system membrane protein, PorP/SprF family n=1 Tax=Alkalitalea saponilacus TaxID=889453 RepID=A0A1T5EWE6_9BACT|nr:PorP/SprF family type IX secretion system membrane protein [Alkalitalea saponilacus]ASB47995.1 hypothetical protein CDL62_01910 [Alkalitalea saponilacus]SKB88226.1 type IX secretion system membrane protein, PorP/SprF family [Alkalitalea saponilacus]
MNKLIILLIPLLFISAHMSGQRYYVTNNYVYDLFLMNPADAGANTECITTNGYYKRQWFGVDMAPTTQLFTVQAPLGSNVGSGTYLYNDQNGNNKKIGIQQTFSTVVTLRENMRGYTRLRFGLSALVEQTSINQANLTPGVMDPVLNNGTLSGTGFNAASGFILNHNQHHIGASVTNIFPQNNPMYNSEFEPELPADMHFHVGSLFKIPNYDIYIEPLVYYRRNSLSDTRMDMNLKMSMPTPDPDLAFWGVLAHRRTVDHQYGKDLGIATTLGLVYRGINFGIEYQHGLTSAQTHLGSAMQLVVGYAFCRSGRPRTLPCHERDEMLQSPGGDNGNGRRFSIFRRR